jgi:virginiamycin B lyase
VWFSEQRGNRIAKIATAPGATPTEYTIPTTVNPHGFTFGPDGNIWFTEFGSTGIGRMTPGGTFAEFPDGTQSWRIVPGADNNLWFTENEASKIGRVTLAGTVSAWPVPTANSNVNGIAAGPTGTVWFTEATSNKVGRVTICQ